MSLRHRTAASQRSWAFTQRPMDGSMRRHIHGPIVPLHRPSLLERLVRRVL